MPKKSNQAKRARGKRLGDVKFPEHADRTANDLRGWADFREVAAKLAAGEIVEHDEIKRVLRAAGTTEGDLAVARLGASFDADVRRFDEAAPTDELLGVAVGYVQGYPAFMEWIGHEWRTDDERTATKYALDAAHERAVKAIIKAAERRGIDGSPLWEYGRICRLLTTENPYPDIGSEYSTWPACLGRRRAALPEDYREAIRAGDAVLVRLNARLNGEPERPADDRAPGEQCDHSPDFRSVRWCGTDYTFTATQAAIVKLLWEAREHNTPDVGVQYLLEAVDSMTSRLPDIFRNNKAWGKLIVNGETKGTKRLADPPKS